jgi:hypothetical protein
VLKAKALWRTWDEPGRQVAVAQWHERDIAVVFPLAWASHAGQRRMIARAKARIAEVEAKARKQLEAGSVLVAFSEHEQQPRALQLMPDVGRRLI